MRETNTTKYERQLAAQIVNAMQDPIPPDDLGGKEAYVAKLLTIYRERIMDQFCRHALTSIKRRFL